jgi:uncharacterized protein YjbJ (UPF0337 family)
VAKGVSGIEQRAGSRCCYDQADQEDETMDKDRIAGSAKQIKGTLKQVVGKAVGDTKLQAEGNAEKAAGKIQNTVGGLKDTLKGK